jgi:hypothetical protein
MDQKYGLNMKVEKYTNYWPDGKIWYSYFKNNKNEHHGISEYFFEFGGRGYVQTYKNSVIHGVILDIHINNYINKFLK